MTIRPDTSINKSSQIKIERAFELDAKVSELSFMKEIFKISKENK